MKSLDPYRLRMMRANDLNLHCFFQLVGRVFEVRVTDPRPTYYITTNVEGVKLIKEQFPCYEGLT